MYLHARWQSRLGAINPFVARVLDARSTMDVGLINKDASLRCQSYRKRDGRGRGGTIRRLYTAHIGYARCTNLTKYLDRIWNMIWWFWMFLIDRLLKILSLASISISSIFYVLEVHFVFVLGCNSVFWKWKGIFPNISFYPFPLYTLDCS